jgi:hypothetical protein
MELLADKTEKAGEGNGVPDEITDIRVEKYIFFQRPTISSYT